MRIGAFSEKFGQSIDTIRHYMELNLLVPEKSGGQYTFDEACERDLNRILYFKERGFSLQEIKTILYYKRLGQLTEHQYHCCYIELVRNKYRNTLKKIQELETVKALLEESLSILEERTSEKQFTLGVDLGVLSHLACHGCSSPLTLQDARIEENQIMEGRFKCSCGITYTVEQGVLMIPGTSGFAGDRFDIADYLHETSPEYLDSIYKGLEWTHRRVDFAGLSGRTLLELGCGIGFFLRHNHRDLPEGAVYFAVDRDISALMYLKDMLERIGVKRQIVFICTDFRTLPLRRGSVDVVVDHSGTSNYSFENTEFLMALMDPWVKPQGQLWGTYICFHKFAPASKVPQAHRKLFKADHIREQLKALGYEITDENDSPPIAQGGIYEDFFQGDESVFRVSLMAQKK